MIITTAAELARTAHRIYFLETLPVRGGGTVTRHASYDPRFECRHGRTLYWAPQICCR